MKIEIETTQQGKENSMPKPKADWVPVLSLELLGNQVIKGLWDLPKVTLPASDGAESPLLFSYFLCT